MAEDQSIVNIARCAEHGLHGERTECFVCAGPVEQVPMRPVVDGDHPIAPAHLLNVLGRGDGRGPGVTPLDGDFPTVIVDELGAVATRTQPRGEMAVYLEVGGRLNKRQERDARALLLSVGQAAELMAELVVAGHAGGPVFGRELEAAIERKQRERGLTNGGDRG